MKNVLSIWHAKRIRSTKAPFFVTLMPRLWQNDVVHLTGPGKRISVGGFALFAPYGAGEENGELVILIQSGTSTLQAPFLPRMGWMELLRIS